MLVALVDLGGEAGLLFNKRSTNLSSHRGQVGAFYHTNPSSESEVYTKLLFQVSFPGGKVDDGDASIVDTALRESEEEIGLFKDQVNSVCVLVYN